VVEHLVANENVARSNRVTRLKKMKDKDIEFEKFVEFLNSSGTHREGENPP
jgi:hypothetical protein